MKSLSLIIPAYNEEGCIEELGRQLIAFFKTYPNYSFEVILVENASLDKTFEKAKALHELDSRFKVIRLSRNFRMDGGLSAGLAYAKSDAVVFMAADLQDPINLIGEFIREWENGFENIYGIVKKRQGTSILRRLNSYLFYKIIHFLTQGMIPKNASDFRLLDKKAYEAVRQMDERNRFIRGLVAWGGFLSKGIEFERPQRFAGVSNAPTWKTIDLALKGICAHSLFPLQAISFLGAIVFISSLIQSIFLKEMSAGMGFGIIIGCLGIIGQYIGLIYEEVKGRPNFIVAETLGL